MYERLGYAEREGEGLQDAWWGQSGEGEMCVTREMEDYVRRSHVSQAAVRVLGGGDGGCMRADGEDMCLPSEVKRMGRVWNERNMFGSQRTGERTGGCAGGEGRERDE